MFVKHLKSFRKLDISLFAIQSNCLVGTMCTSPLVKKQVFYRHFAYLFLTAITHSMVGTSGLEPPTSRLSGVRSNHLSYAPIVSLREPFEIITFEKRVSQFRRSETANYFFQQTARLSGVVISAYLLFLNPCVQSLVLVEMRRIELLTPCVQGRCSPS